MMDDLLSMTHLGDEYDKYLNAVIPPVFMNSLHVFPTFEEYAGCDASKKGEFKYGRVSNPTVHILEEKVAALEHGCRAAAFGSGMAATSAAILATCKAGSHIICMRDVYGPVKNILNRYMIPKLNMSVTYWSGESLDELEKAILPETDLIMIESPATFVFTVVDIAGVAAIAKKHGVKTYIDNTYCTPLYQKPLDLGIDLVMHTLTKYIGGHSDIMGGILTSADEELMIEIQFTVRELFGANMGPMEAWLAIRGLRTMALRVAEHGRTAQIIAEYLEKHERVERVYYTGLPSHPQRELIEKQQKGHTGLLSFVLKDSPEEAVKVINKLTLFGKGCSWGGFESLALCPLYTATEEEIKFLNLSDHDRGLIRIHCGLEGVDNLMEDLENALERVLN